MVIDDNYILDWFYGRNHKKLNKNKLNNIDSDVLKYLNNRYIDSLSIEETLQRIKLNIDVHPICPICGNPIKYVGGTRMFLTTCGNIECSKKLNQQHLKETTLIKYGVDNPAKSDIVKDKIKNTCLEKYGYVSALLNDKVKEKTKQTNLEKYGDVIAQKNEKVKNKIKTSNINICIERYNETNVMKVSYIMQRQKDTNLKKYGVECVFANKEIREISKQTSLKRYGVEYPSQSNIIKELIKEHNLIKYGETHPCKTEYYRKLLSDIVSSKDVQDKMKKTYLEKYGVDNPFKSKEIQDKIKQTNLEKYGYEYPIQSKEIQNKYKHTCLEKYGYEYAAQAKEIQQKIYETKKKNGSYGKSKEEDYLYNVLVEIYGKDNVERQYSSDLYPFACDFYIISEDLYIEYNGIWTHGHTPYIGSKENEMKLKEWKQKAETSKFYQNTIITWTISDIKKRNTAKENNLNYIELWDLNDVEMYVSKLNFK